MTRTMTQTIECSTRDSIPLALAAIDPYKMCINTRKDRKGRSPKSLKRKKLSRLCGKTHGVLDLSKAIKLTSHSSRLCGKSQAVLDLSNAIQLTSHSSSVRRKLCAKRNRKRPSMAPLLRVRVDTANKAIQRKQMASPAKRGISKSPKNIINVYTKKTPFHKHHLRLPPKTHPILAHRVDPEGNFVFYKMIKTTDCATKELSGRFKLGPKATHTNRSLPQKCLPETDKRQGKVEKKSLEFPLSSRVFTPKSVQPGKTKAKSARIVASEKIKKSNPTELSHMKYKVECVKPDEDIPQKRCKACKRVCKRKSAPPKTPPSHFIGHSGRNLGSLFCFIPPRRKIRARPRSPRKEGPYSLSSSDNSGEVRVQTNTKDTNMNKSGMLFQVKPCLSGLRGSTPPSVSTLDDRTYLCDKPSWAVRLHSTTSPEGKRCKCPSARVSTPADVAEHCLTNAKVSLGTEPMDYNDGKSANHSIKPAGIAADPNSVKGNLSNKINFHSYPSPAVQPAKSYPFNKDEVLFHNQNLRRSQNIPNGFQYSVTNPFERDSADMNGNIADDSPFGSKHDERLDKGRIFYSLVSDSEGLRPSSDHNQLYKCRHLSQRRFQQLGKLQKAQKESKLVSKKRPGNSRLRSDTQFGRNVINDKSPRFYDAKPEMTTANAVGVKDRYLNSEPRVCKGKGHDDIAGCVKSVYDKSKRRGGKGDADTDTRQAVHDYTSKSSLNGFDAPLNTSDLPDFQGHAEVFNKHCDKIRSHKWRHRHEPYKMFTRSNLLKQQSSTTGSEAALSVGHQDPYCDLRGAYEARKEHPPSLSANEETSSCSLGVDISSGDSPKNKNNCSPSRIPRPIPKISTEKPKRNIVSVKVPTTEDKPGLVPDNSARRARKKAVSRPAVDGQDAPKTLLGFQGNSNSRGMRSNDRASLRQDNSRTREDRKDTPPPPTGPRKKREINPSIIPLCKVSRRRTLSESRSLHTDSSSSSKASDKPKRMHSKSKPTKPKCHPSTKKPPKTRMMADQEVMTNFPSLGIQTSRTCVASVACQTSPRCSDGEAGTCGLNETRVAGANKAPMFNPSQWDIPPKRTSLISTENKPHQTAGHEAAALDADRKTKGDTPIFEILSDTVEDTELKEAYGETCESVSRGNREELTHMAERDRPFRRYRSFSFAHSSNEAKLEDALSLSATTSPGSSQPTKSWLARPRWEDANVEEINRRVERALLLRQQLQKLKKGKTAETPVDGKDDEDTFRPDTAAATATSTAEMAARTATPPVVDAMSTGSSRRLRHRIDPKSVLPTTPPAWYPAPQGTNDDNAFSGEDSVRVVCGNRSTSITYGGEVGSRRMGNSQLTSTEGGTHSFNVNSTENTDPGGDMLVDLTFSVPENISQNKSIPLKVPRSSAVDSHQDTSASCTPFKFRVVNKSSSETTLSQLALRSREEDNRSCESASHPSKISPPIKISKMENLLPQSEYPKLVGELVQALPKVPLSSFVEWFIETSHPDQFTANSEGWSSPDDRNNLPSTKNNSASVSTDTEPSVIILTPTQATGRLVSDKNLSSSSYVPSRRDPDSSDHSDPITLTSRTKAGRPLNTTRVYTTTASDDDRDTMVDGRGEEDEDEDDDVLSDDDDSDDGDDDDDDDDDNISSIRRIILTRRDSMEESTEGNDTPGSERRRITIRQSSDISSLLEKWSQSQPS